jgi:hypothetical protein
MADLDSPETKRRVIVVLRRPSQEGSRTKLVAAAAIAALAVGLSFGYRAAEMVGGTPSELVDGRPVLTERVNGGIYALELALPHGKARWMLEFDAEIVTHDGPSNPLELRNALEKLVIDATSTPLVQTATEPDIEMRRAMLAMAKQDFPWLVDIYMTRSDLRAEVNRLSGIGEAMRSGN